MTATATSGMGPVTAALLVELARVIGRAPDLAVLAEIRARTPEWPPPTRMPPGTRPRTVQATPLLRPPGVLAPSRGSAAGRSPMSPRAVPRTLHFVGEAVLRAVGPLSIPDVIALARKHSGGTVNLDPTAAFNALITVSMLGAARKVNGGRWVAGRGWVVPVTPKLEAVWAREYERCRPPSWDVQFRVEP